MSSKVEVLCPNGHRVNIKTTVNTKLVQVLEEACNKKGFLPTSDYDLKHGTSKKPLDLTLTVRFAGLPNHAKLEMVKAAKSRHVSSVMVALQLDSGERTQKEWNPTAKLWEILEHSQEETGKQLVTAPEGSHPVFVYMREEIVGEYALRETSLHDLGLISGRAILRLVYKPVESSILQEIKQKIDKEKARRANILSKAAASSQSETTMIGTTEVQSTAAEVKQVPTEAMETSADTKELITPDSTTVTKLEEMSTEPSDQQEAMETEDRAAKSTEPSTAEMPMEADTVEQSNAFEVSRSAPRPCTSGATGAITPHTGPHTNIPGVQIFQPGESLGLSAEQEQIARQMAEAIMPGIFPQRSTAELERLRQEREKRIQQAKPKKYIPQQRSMQPNFADFKFPEETKGQNLYNNELSNNEAEDYKPCDREAVIYSQQDIKSSNAVPVEPGDDFFEITELDLKKMMSDLQRNLVEQSEQPLMTQSMRRAQVEQRLSKYSHVFIRFTFPDKLVLQGTFRPRETVYNLYKFVKEHLEDKTLPFYLYTSPPRHLLENKTQTLMEASLVPMTVVYFGSDVRKDHYLSSVVLKEISSQVEATKVVVAHMPSSAETPSSSSGPQGMKRSTAQGQGSPAQTSDGGGKKVPKWFKIGK